MHLPPGPIRWFSDTKRLARIVAEDIQNGEVHRYKPMNDDAALVESWCICTIDTTWTVVGLHVAKAKLENPISGEDVAKEQFNAIHAALATHKVNVHKAAWLVFVLPSASYSKFPHQCATVGPGEQQRNAGHIWRHTQGKLEMRLDDQGKPPLAMQHAR